MTRPYKGKRRTNKKKHKRGRGRSQRGGSPIRYTRCGPACPYFSRTPQYSGGGKKLTRHRRRRSQRGGSPIRYTRCGPACPYFSRTPQYSGGGRKSRRRNQKRRRIRKRTRRSRRRRRGGAPSPLWDAAIAAAAAINYNTLKEKAWEMVKAQLETNPQLKGLVDGGDESIGAEEWKEVNIVPEPKQVLPPGLFHRPNTIKIISGVGRDKFKEIAQVVAKKKPAVATAIASSGGLDQFLNKLIVIMICHELVHWFQYAAPCTGVNNLDGMRGKAADLGEAQEHCWKESFATAIATHIAVSNGQGQVEIAGRVLLMSALEMLLPPAAQSDVKYFYDECYFKPLQSYNCSGQANFNITADQYKKICSCPSGGCERRRGWRKLIEITISRII